MEIPVIDRISGFEAEINRLQDPSLLSRIFHLLRIEEISQIQSFWTWGALILAFFATFGSVISRVKFVIVRFRKAKSVISEPLIRTLSSIDDEEEDDESWSSSSSSDEEDEPMSPFENQRPFDEDSRVVGSENYIEFQGRNRKFKLCRCRSGGDWFSWSDFANGKSVVKSWEGLGLGFENSSGSLISLWDLSKNEITCSCSGGGCQIPTVSISSPAVIMSAGSENNSKVGLRVWDTRVGRQNPAIFAEWKPRRGKVVEIDSGEADKLCVSDDGSLVAVGDIRNVALPLEDLTESDVDTWWDADAVIVDGERDI